MGDEGFLGYGIKAPFSPFLLAAIEFVIPLRKHEEVFVDVSQAWV